MFPWSQWLFGDWHSLMPMPLANTLLASIASLCGAIVGTEREKKEKPTGTRTLALVSLGASVFTMLSEHLGNHDGHIAANIISGIGFLGAGVIIHGRYGILGLTSASTIWIMAAIGMTVGAGYAVAGLALSFFVFGTLSIVGSLERRYIGPCKFSTLQITYDAAGGKTLIRLEELLDEFGSPGMLVTEHRENGEHGTATIRYCCVHQHHRELLARFAEMTEVQTIVRNIEGSRCAA
jgi:putative Mg2+ transporter-C (MgtC) family protein